MVSSISPNFFKDLAIKQGKKLASVPLKDQGAAKLLTGNNSIDCFIVKDGSIVGGKGFHSEKHFEEESGALLEKLQAIVADGVDVVKEWTASLNKNVKDL
jgi:hypothetical protein